MADAWGRWRAVVCCRRAVQARLASCVEAMAWKHLWGGVCGEEVVMLLIQQPDRRSWEVGMV